MKKIVSILMLSAFVAAGLSGCYTGPATPDTIQADRVNIVYGVSSYAMLEEDVAVVAKVADAFSGLKFEKTGREIDISTAINVVFENGGETTARFIVDKNGVFLLDDDTTYYQLKSGSFDYDEVYGIYENSRDTG